MNNLYNKIYNAVNEGIQKALLIDPDQNDVSINYSYSKIDNSIDPLLLEFVDLGLPSRNLWCKYNLGATCENNDVSSWYGDFYAWGEIRSKEIFGWQNYEYSIDGGAKFSKYNFADGLTTLKDKHDIAHIKYSENIHSKIAKNIQMPLIEDLRELITNTYFEWTENYKQINGLNGIELISKNNHNSIFIPVTGLKYFDNAEKQFIHYNTKYGIYLWSKSKYIKNDICAYGLNFNYRDILAGINVSPAISLNVRQYGMPIRPIYKIN